MMDISGPAAGVDISGDMESPVVGTERSISFSIASVSLGAESRAIPHSGNARLHWAARHRWNKAWSQRSGWMARMALNGSPAPGWMKSAVTITLHTIKLLDHDNAHAAVKPILDGLKGILIADDAPDHITLTVQQVRAAKRCDERVEIEVVGK